MKSILLDTNSYSALHKGNNIIKKEVEKAGVACISVVTLGELYRGFKIGSKEKENIKLLEGFLQDRNVKILGTNKGTAKVYGEVSYIIRKQGTPLPTNDVWIAAQAIENDLVLVTYDTHFLKIPKVKLWKGLR